MLGLDKDSKEREKALLDSSAVESLEEQPEGLFST